MARPLTGAAKAAQTRRILLDEARAAIADRGPESVRVTEALLIRAHALTPRRREVTLTIEADATAFAAELDRLVVSPGSTMTRRDVRVLPLTGPQRGWQ